MSLNLDAIATVKGMLARGDKQHDIAAHFSINGGRVAEIASGKNHPEVRPKPIHELPPLVKTREQRWIDPGAPIEGQIRVLQDLLRQPPQGSRVLTISPALAAWILDNLNNRNRKRRASKIQRFANDMKAKRWALTGDTIKFSKRLEDGQNRLCAVVRSNMPLVTHVVFGIPEDAFDVIDTGTARTNTDVMTLAGVPSPKIAAQAVRWLMIYETNNPLDRGKSFDNAELLKFYQDHVDPNLLDDVIKVAAKVGRRCPSGSLAAHLYMFHVLKQASAVKLMHDLSVPARGGKKLLDTLDKLRVQRLGRLHETLVNALIIKTWLAYRDGVAVTAATLKWDESREYPDFGWKGIA